MKKLLSSTLLLTTLSCSLSFGQSYTAVIETNSLLSSSGATLSFGDSINGSIVNVFHGVVDASTDLDALFDPLVSSENFVSLNNELSNISWSALSSSSANGVEWTTNFDESISVGQKVIIAAVNAVSPSSISAGSELGIFESVDFLSNQQNAVIGFTFDENAYNIIVGTAGTQSANLVGFTAVPEPSTYAALLGALALGFVVYRRRRS
jgi:hypothetical protein